MLRIVCGLLDIPSNTTKPELAGRARDLSVAWLRWGYFGEILEDSSMDALLARAADAGYDYCLIQGRGHILAEHSGPDGGRPRSFFETLQEWIASTQFCIAGVAGRCILADLTAWRSLGRPRSDTLPLTGFGPELSCYFIDLSPDLSTGGPFLRSLEELCEKARRGVFILNYEPYRDVEEAPSGFHSPVSMLYSVAAGFKPNRILQTHGFDAQTRIMFFDYSRQALAFRRQLCQEWDGWDYTNFLKNIFPRMIEAGTHYYLWPGASAGEMDWKEMERLWATEVSRWGGAEAFASHWSRYRELRHEYVLANVFSDQGALLEVIQDRAGSIIWWSNAFCTVYSATHYSLEQKRQIYEQWVRGLAGKAPRLFLYGADHSNSSVNGMAAREYWDRYSADGGDPLRARNFHRGQIRF